MPAFDGFGFDQGGFDGDAGSSVGPAPLDYTGALLAELYPDLNAASAADLVFWTEDELYGFVNEALKRAAREAICFTAVTVVTVPAGSIEVALPTGAVAPLWMAWDGVALRSASVAELEALDDDWERTRGTPTRWTLDLGLGAIRLYPLPAQDGTLGLLLQGTPTLVSAGAGGLLAIAPFAKYLHHAVVGAARAKVSDAHMPEIAAHAAQRTALYLEVFRRYWGAGG